MPDLTRWVSGADFVEMGEFLAEEGSKFVKSLGPPRPKKYITNSRSSAPAANDCAGTGVMILRVLCSCVICNAGAPQGDSTSV